MANELPEGTLQFAQTKIANLLNPVQEEAQESDPPNEQADQHDREAAQHDLQGQPEEDFSDSEEESPDYNDETEGPRTFTIKVRGQNREVTEDELVKLASMGEDYTIKTQDLAEQRKRLEAITSESDAARARMSQLLPELETNLQSIKKQLEAEPDWDKLYEADPVKAARLQREFDRKKVENSAELQKVQAEQQQLQAEEEKRLGQARNDYLVEQGKQLLSQIPEWKNDKTAVSEKTEIEKWALSSGFLDQNQLNNIIDAGSVVMMRKAWLYDQGKTRVKNQRSKTSKTLSPGSKGSAPKRDVLKSKREAFIKSGKAKDAQHLVESILNRK